ncbi:MAG: alpha/beta hydrolase family protein [Solirubrobacteraceae bacterium]
MSPRRSLPLLALAAVAAALPAAAGAAPATSIPTSFYTPTFGTPPHGGIMRSLRITGGSLPQGGKSYAVIYSSKSPSGQDVPTSGIITIPNGKKPKGGFPVVSWAHGTTGIADSCAPSRHALDPPTNSYLQGFRKQATHWVKRGYVFAQTDYQGLGTPGLHQYLIGEAEGRSVVDIVTAAHALSKSVGKRWVAIGHSQGGHAALWAAALAKGYAPSLKLAGTVPLAPATHIGEQSALIETIESNPFGGLPALIVAGAVENLGIAPESVFSDKAMALYPQVDKVCLDQLSKPDSFGGLGLKEHFRDPSTTRQSVIDTISANDPEDIQSIPGPIFIAQGTADTTVFPMYTDQTVEGYKGRGFKVTYKKYEGATHTTVPDAARKDTTYFIDKVLG